MRVKLSAGEKLILLMLCEISERSKGDREIDTNFVRETIQSDHLWAFDWEYTGLHYEREPMPPSAQETIDILEMFSVTLHQFKQRHSEADQGEIKAAVGSNAHLLEEFPGFNVCDEHYGLAKHIVERLNRFSNLRGLMSHSHPPMSLLQYRRMLRVYLPIRKNIWETLSKQQLIDIFSAAGEFIA
jgi:uncharacterized protein